MFDEYLARWGLTPDGEPIMTHSSRLLPVRRAGTPAMLKIAVEAEEKFGALLMSWWNGQGAARVLAHEDDALLVERAEGKGSLADMARRGDDDAATRILCQVVAQLHAPRERQPPPLMPLTRWFQALAPAAMQHGGILAVSAATARELLATPQEVVGLCRIFEGVSELLICYPLRVSEQHGTTRVVERNDDYASCALSLLPRDRYRPAWHHA
jgi:streptomycin 6-kinase